MSAYELGGWAAVFDDPVNQQAVDQLLRAMRRMPRRWAWSLPVPLKTADLGDHTIADTLQRLGRDEADQGQELGLAGRINLVFRRHDAGQAVDGAAQLVVVQVLQLVGQQDDQHVLMRRHHAGGLGIGVHSCCAPPLTAGVVALARVEADRNRSAIFSRARTGTRSRTAFATCRAAIEILYRALAWLGDLVAGLGARLSRGAA